MTAQEEFWTDPQAAAVDKEEADGNAAAEGPASKKQRLAGGDGNLELDVIELKGKVDRLIKSTFAKVDASKKSSQEELDKSVTNKSSYEDTYAQLQSRTNAIVWVLAKSEEEFQALLKTSIVNKEPLPVGEGMLTDLHTKAFFEATSHM